jgi:hypothetical protein
MKKATIKTRLFKARTIQLADKGRRMWTAKCEWRGEPKMYMRVIRAKSKEERVIRRGRRATVELLACGARCYGIFDQLHDRAEALRTALMIAEPRVLDGAGDRVTDRHVPSVRSSCVISCAGRLVRADVVFQHASVWTIADVGGRIAARNAFRLVVAQRLRIAQPGEQLLEGDEVHVVILGQQVFDEFGQSSSFGLRSEPVDVEVELERSSIRLVVMFEVLLQKVDHVFRVFRLVGRREHALIRVRTHVVLVEQRINRNLPQSRVRLGRTVQRSSQVRRVAFRAFQRLSLARLAFAGLACLLRTLAVRAGRAKTSRFAGRLRHQLTSHLIHFVERTLFLAERSLSTIVTARLTSSTAHMMMTIVLDDVGSVFRILDVVRIRFLALLLVIRTVERLSIVPSERPERDRSFRSDQRSVVRQSKVMRHLVHRVAARLHVRSSQADHIVSSEWTVRVASVAELEKDFSQSDHFFRPVAVVRRVGPPNLRSSMSVKPFLIAINHFTTDARRFDQNDRHLRD